MFTAQFLFGYQKSTTKPGPQYMGQFRYFLQEQLGADRRNVTMLGRRDTGSAEHSFGAAFDRTIV
jgi:hypothetical protein